MTVAGAVLCGGSSRRMGTDKALLEIDGIPMAERVAIVLEAAGCDPVVFIGGDAAALGVLGRHVVPDGWPGDGPAGGVLTALQALREAEAVVVVACDLPDLTSEAVTAVIGDGDVGVDLRVAVTDRLEPMLACWPTSVHAQIERLFRSGRRALHDVVAGFDAVRVPVDSGAVRNVNQPQDLLGQPKHPGRSAG